MNLIKHRFYKLIGVSHYYENNYGIKVYNKHPFKLAGNTENVTINPNIVRLGFDGLNDNYTLLDKVIIDSPHFDLVRRINNNETIVDCDYIDRERKGCLDGRDTVVIENSMHVKKCQQSIEAISKGIYDPPILYYLNDSYYVFDGKHRIAVCCILNVECRCLQIDIEELKNDQHTNALFNQMKLRSNYLKNVSFLNSLFLS